MLKATITLQNGTLVEIEGTPEEVQKLLQFYGDQTATKSSPQRQHKVKSSHIGDSTRVGNGIPTEEDLATIVNTIKTCDEAQEIRAQILDRTIEVNRVLLPLYIMNQYMADAFGLTTGEIETITIDLGIKVFKQNALRVFTRTGSDYVIGDRVRKSGQVTRYKLNRRGVQYIKETLKVQSDGKQK
jgi:hypothetical protein